MPYCFSRSFIKFQGHTGEKIADLVPNWLFPDCNSSLNLPMDLKWRTKKAWCSIEEVLYYFFEVIHQISRSYRLKNRWFESNLSKIFRPVAAIKSLRFALLTDNYILIFRERESFFSQSRNHISLSCIHFYPEWPWTLRDIVIISCVSLSVRLSIHLSQKMQLILLSNDFMYHPEIWCEVTWSN